MSADNLTGRELMNAHVRMFDPVARFRFWILGGNRNVYLNHRWVLGYGSPSIWVRWWAVLRYQVRRLRRAVKNRQTK